MAATLSLSMRRLTALAASMRSLRVSSSTSSTGWPSSWGCIWCAVCTPSQTIWPMAAAAPVMGK